MLTLISTLGLSACGGLDSHGAPPPNESTPEAQLAAVASSEGVQAENPRMPSISDALPVKDQARWTLPTDSYYGGQTARLTSDAYIIAYAHCLRQAGYTDYPIHIIPFSPSPETDTASGGGHRFSEEIAATYGYRVAPDPGRIVSVDLPDPRSMPKGFIDDEVACSREVSARLAGTTVEEYEKLLEEGSPLAQLHESPLEQWRVLFTPELRDVEKQLDRLHVDTDTPDLTQAAERWRECMAPLNILDLPEHPWSNASHRLPSSLRDRWNWETGGQPSADEIAVASHDAACRRSSGWFDTLYEHTWRVHEEFITAHRDELQPLLERNRQSSVRAIEVLASFGYK